MFKVAVAIVILAVGGCGANPYLREFTTADDVKAAQRGCVKQGFDPNTDATAFNGCVSETLEASRK